MNLDLNLKRQRSMAKWIVCTWNNKCKVPESHFQLFKEEKKDPGHRNIINEEREVGSEAEEVPETR